MTLQATKEIESPMATGTQTAHRQDGKTTTTQKLSNRDKVITSLLAGAVAGGTAKTCIAPFDRTKIYFQTRNMHFSFREAFIHILDTYRAHGFTSLWRGNSATLVRILPYASIQYASHEQFKRLLHVETNAEKRAHPERSFFAGSLAGIVSTAATYPLDLARARMAINHDYRGILHVFYDMVRWDGFLSLYRGFIPTLLGIIPYAGTTFFTYETCKRLHHEWVGDDEPNPLERLAFGATAGILGQTASYPLDIVRRRMQTRSAPEYRTARGTIKKVLYEEGIIGGFYKGLSLNWIKGPVAVGISFMTFDLTQKHLRQLLPHFYDR